MTNFSSSGKSDVFEISGWGIGKVIHGGTYLFLVGVPPSFAIIFVILCDPKFPIVVTSPPRENLTVGGDTHSEFLPSFVGFTGFGED